MPWLVFLVPVPSVGVGVPEGEVVCMMKNKIYSHQHYTLYINRGKVSCWEPPPALILPSQAFSRFYTNKKTRKTFWMIKNGIPVGYFNYEKSNFPPPSNHYENWLFSIKSFVGGGFFLSCLSKWNVWSIMMMNLEMKPAWGLPFFTALHIHHKLNSFFVHVVISYNRQTHFPSPYTLPAE